MLGLKTCATNAYQLSPQWLMKVFSADWFDCVVGPMHSRTYFLTWSQWAVRPARTVCGGSHFTVCSTAELLHSVLFFWSFVCCVFSSEQICQLPSHNWLGLWDHFVSFSWADSRLLSFSVSASDCSLAGFALSPGRSTMAHSHHTVMVGPLS